jgi:hypothetical protein
MARLATEQAGMVISAPAIGFCVVPIELATITNEPTPSTGLATANFELNSLAM